MAKDCNEGVKCGSTQCIEFGTINMEYALLLDSLITLMFLILSVQIIKEKLDKRVNVCEPANGQYKLDRRHLSSASQNH